MKANEIVECGEKETIIDATKNYKGEVKQL